MREFVNSFVLFQLASTILKRVKDRENGENGNTSSQTVHAALTEVLHVLTELMTHTLENIDHDLLPKLAFKPEIQEAQFWRDLEEALQRVFFFLKMETAILRCKSFAGLPALFVFVSDPKPSDGRAGRADAANNSPVVATVVHPAAGANSGGSGDSGDSTTAEKAKERQLRVELEVQYNIHHILIHHTLMHHTLIHHTLMHHTLMHHTLMHHTLMHHTLMHHTLMHHTPYTTHHTPYTIHHTPYTIH
jgi:hypothetical protein